MFAPFLLPASLGKQKALTGEKQLCLAKSSQTRDAKVPRIPDMCS